MWSRRDQLQAYQFLRRRLVSAVVVGDANHTESPTRRVIVSTIAGCSVALLVAATLIVIGVLRPNGARVWLKGGSVIVEKETGARFVLDQNGTLHPALNYASARLFLGSPRAGTVAVSRKSLAVAPRGAMVGIPGAPDSLPPSDRLLSGPWSLCSNAEQAPGAPVVVSVTAALGVPAGRTVLAEEEGVVVTVPDLGRRYLVTDGRRFLLPSKAVAQALGYADTSTDLSVGVAWVSALPAGPDLNFVAVAGAGERGPTLEGRGTTLGQVFRVDQLSGTTQYYVLTRQGLSALTETEAQLILADPGVPATAGPLTPAGVAGAALAPAPLVDSGYPDRLPRLARAATAAAGRSSTVCATLAADGTGITAIVDLRAAALRGVVVGGARTAPADADRTARADEVFVPPGRGALVRESVGAGFPTSAAYLVTDQGTKYPLPDARAVDALGYRGATVTTAPGAVLDLLPTGPALDPADVAARVGG